MVGNYATHNRPKVRPRPARDPQWTLHFVPTSRSWLNTVEGSPLTGRRLKNRGPEDQIDRELNVNIKGVILTIQSVPDPIGMRRKDFKTRWEMSSAGQPTQVPVNSTCMHLTVEKSSLTRVSRAMASWASWPIVLKEWVDA
jgi:hypothetical protein